MKGFSEGIYSDSVKILIEEFYYSQAIYADTIPIYKEFIEKY